MADTDNAHPATPSPAANTDTATSTSNAPTTEPTKPNNAQQTQLTRAEQLAGAKVIRGWHKDHIMAVVRLPARERDLVILAAALLNIQPKDTP